MLRAVFARAAIARRSLIVTLTVGALLALPLVPGLASRGHSHQHRGHRPHGFARRDYPRIPRSLTRSGPSEPAHVSGSAERRRSRTAYRGRSRRRALRLLRKRFPQVAAIPSAATPQLPPGARVESYLGKYAERIAVPKSHRRQVVVSPLPVRARDGAGRKARVSLGLRREDSDFAPVNPLVDTSLPQRLGDGVAVGDQGVRVKPASPAAADADGSPDGDQVFYPDTATDQDVLVTPAPTGVELFTQLRSPDAPEAEVLEFELPDGASLRATDDGGAEVVRGDERLTRIMAPSAADADGRPVPARYGVSGNLLTVRAEHRDGDYAYPILVDPLLEDWGSRSAWADSWFYNPGRDIDGWFFADSPQNAFFASLWGFFAPVSYGSGYGLYAIAPPDTYLPAGSYGEWLWRAPGQTTFIPRADFGLMYRDTQADTKNQSVLVDGIYSERQHAFTGYHQFNGRVMGQSDTVLPGANVSNADPRAGNLALFALAFPFDHKRKTPTTAYLGGAGIYLDDPEAPTITGVSHSNANAGGWVDPQNATSTVSASDPGLGVQSMSLTARTPDGRTPTDNETTNCDGTRFFRCPPSASITFGHSSLGLPDGTTTMSVTASDPLGHTSAASTWHVRADSSAPTLSLTGRLRDAAGKWLDDSPAALQIDARDGDAAHPSSGVRSVEVLVDGQRADYAQQECEQSCPLSRSFTLDPAGYGDGAHTVRVVATDQVGHQTDQSWDVKIDRAAPALDLSGSLKDHASDWLTADSYGLTASATDAGTGVNSLEIQVDGQRKVYSEQPCDGGGCPLSRDLAFALADYQDGIHAVRATATDFAGHATTRTLTVKIDRADPGVALSGTLKDGEGTWLNGQSYTLSAAATDDPGSGLKSLDISLDGISRVQASQPCDAGGCALSRDYTLPAGSINDGRHTVTVVAVDQAGRRTERTVSVRVDHTAPSATLFGDLRDRSSQWLTGTSYGFSAGSDDFASGVKSVETKVDGQRLDYAEKACDGRCQLQRDLTYVTATYGDGVHTIEEVVTDQAGNTARTSFQVKVDRADPGITLSGALKDTEGTWLNGDSYLLSMVASDSPGSGVKEIDVLVDDFLKQFYTQSCTTGGCPMVRDFDFRPASYGDGRHTVKIVVTDTAGRQTTRTLNVKTDRRAPFTGLFGDLRDRSSQWLSGTSYAFTASSDDFTSGVKSVETKVDGQRLDYAEKVCDGRCQISRDLTYVTATYGDGFHTVQEVVTDQAGNVASESFPVKVDRTAPDLALSGTLKDGEGSWLGGDSYTLSAVAADAPGSGVTNLEFKVDGLSKLVATQTCAAGGCSLSRDFAFRPADYSEGSHTVTVIATDASGRQTQRSVAVKVDRLAPSLTLSGTLKDHAGEWLSGDSYALTGAATDSGSGLKSIEVLVDGQRADYGEQACPNGACSLSRAFAFATAAYGDGAHTVRVVATDQAGRTSEQTLPAKVDRTLPTFSVSGTLKDAEGSELTEPSYALSVNAFDGDSQQLQSGVTSVEVKADGARIGYASQTCATGGCPLLHDFTLDPATLGDGIHTISVIVKDGANHTATTKWNVAIPQHPDTPAPELNHNDPATLTSDATRFLFDGPDAIQSGVAQDAIDPAHQSVLRAKVTNRAGQPLAGVQVTAVEQPQAGSSLSRDDGQAYLAVNGGGTVTMRFQKPGYLPVDRTVKTRWEDYAFADDVVMIPLDDHTSAIDLSSPIADAQVARGSTVTDDDGQRQATVIFPTGTHASMQMPDGSSQPLDRLTVRQTEYTVGDRGPAAMPADLPKTSSYTYAADFTVDEAMQAGATSVDFDRPVASYTDNFVGFPVGDIVPSGYYNREKAAWEPSDDGRVVKVLSEQNGLAQLDVLGNGTPATAAQLAQLGVTDDELRKVAELYDPGKTLWRVPLRHFSIHDFNWYIKIVKDALPPPDPTDRQDPDCQNEQSGSIIGCESRTLGEEIDLPGTDFGLHYESDRTPGRTAANSLPIRLSDANIPKGVSSIKLEVYVAGRVFKSDFENAPNQTHTFVWDGKDVFGRKLEGAQNAHIKIGYEYPDDPYADGVSWSVVMSQSPGNGGFTPGMIADGRQALTEWTEYDRSVAPFDARSQGLGSWSLDVHHAYDPVRRQVHMGDGTRRTADALPNVITTFAGGGPTSQQGDGAKATDTWTLFPSYVGAAPNGDVWMSDAFRLRRIDTQGFVRVGAGNGTPGFAGDGGPAAAAQVNAPGGMDFGADGSVYFADSGNRRVRRIRPDGVIQTVAGNGATDGDFAQEGRPATEATIYPNDVAVSPDGSYFIDDGRQNKIFKVTPDGRIHTYAGNGRFCFDTKPEPRALDAGLCDPHDIALGPDGTVYWSEPRDDRVRAVAPDGDVFVAAGGGGLNDGVGDGGKATAVSLFNPGGIDVSPDGTLYVSEALGNRVRAVSRAGIITTAAGNGDGNPDTTAIGDGGPALKASIYEPRAIAAGPDGNLYIADFRHSRLRRVAPALPGMSQAGYAVPSEDGQEVYDFDKNGRHLKTVNATTGALVYRFEYDGAGRLSAVVDGDGNRTTIERNAAGDPTAIVGPYGTRTTLDVDANGYLKKVTNAAGESTLLDPSDTGLLQSLTDPKGQTTEFQYDGAGAFESEKNRAQATQTVSRSDDSDGFATTHTTPMGRQTTYDVRWPTAGGEVRKVTTPDGLTHKLETKPWSDQERTDPDGTKIYIQHGGDPRFDMASPLKGFRITTPGGLDSSVSELRTAGVNDPTDPTTLKTETRTLRVNGRDFKSTFDGATRSYTNSLPSGLASTVDVDAQGRPLVERYPGHQPVTTHYDAHGRIDQVTEGTHQYTIGYDARGLVASVTDPLQRQSTYSYDDAERLKTETLPGGAVVGYTYDRNGNLASITPPGRPAHTFTSSPLDFPDSVFAPGQAAAPTHYDYNDDGDLKKVTRPDGSTIGLDYDDAGRVQKVTDAVDGVTTYGYDAQTGMPSAVDAPSGVHTALAYDGTLPTSETLSGPVAGSTSRTYDNDLRIRTTSVNHGTPVTFGYDIDGKLTTAGALTINHDAATGFESGTTLGQTSTATTYDSYGDPASFTGSAQGSSLFGESFTRDDLGRIATRTETHGASSATYGYTYDDAGRLEEVDRDGALVAHYAYDGNGNRLSQERGDGTNVSAQYDDQDRLTRYGAKTYGYTANGELRTRTNTASGDVDRFSYDGFGALRHVDLANDHSIDYVLDADGNRVGKKVDGSLVQGFLYAEQIGPAAELAADGSVKSRFVYGTKSTVPDYMLRDGHTYRILSDSLGSPRVVVDADSGEVKQELDYDEFGNVTRDTNSGFQPFGYAGGIYDRDTGLVQFGAREYDPETGRFTSKDPLFFDGGDTNLYGYVFADPVNNVDPQGTSVLDVVSNVAAGFGDHYTGGLTKWVRGKLGIDNVDYCSTAYQAGGVVGDVYPVGPGDAFRTLKGWNRLREAEDAADEASTVARFAKQSRGEGPHQVPSGKNNSERFPRIKDKKRGKGNFTENPNSPRAQRERGKKTKKSRR